MRKPEFDNRVFLAFTAAGLLLGAGGMMLPDIVGLSDCRGLGAHSPVYLLTASGIPGVQLGQIWPIARKLGQSRAMAARAATVLITILAAAIMQPILYCALESGGTSFIAIMASMAPWIGVLGLVYLIFGRHGERLQRLSAASGEKTQA